MLIISDININDFKAWQGGAYTLNIVRKQGKIEELQVLLEELYPNGASATEINDFLWFEDEYIMDALDLYEPIIWE